MVERHSFRITASESLGLLWLARRRQADLHDFKMLILRYGLFSGANIAEQGLEGISTWIVRFLDKHSWLCSCTFTGRDVGRPTCLQLSTKRPPTAARSSCEDRHCYGHMIEHDSLEAGGSEMMVSRAQIADQEGTKPYQRHPTIHHSLTA